MRFIKNIFGTLSRALGKSHCGKTSIQSSERFFKPRERSSLANLGFSTRYHADWENYDLYPCDPSIAYLKIAESLPIPNKTYSAVHCSHVLKHLSRGIAPRFLGEILRILKPGGVVRLVVPDSGECHLWMYDEYSLGKLLHEVGFVNPRKCSATVSMTSNFSSYLLDCNESGAVYKPDSLFMEARKSGNTKM